MRISIIKNHFKDQENINDLFHYILLATIAVIGLDIVGNWLNGYEKMITWELVLLIVLIVIYSINIKRHIPYMLHIYFAILSIFIVVTMIVPGYNPEFALFAIALLPAAFFALFGLKEGLYFNIFVVLLLLIAILFIIFGEVDQALNKSIYFQTMISYAFVIVPFYYIEKRRLFYEQALEQAIKEKNTLLKEVHHRAKNNLQVVMGLLELEAMRTYDQDCKKKLTAQRGRLYSMSLLHDHLSHTESYEKVNLDLYLKRIIDTLKWTAPEHELKVQLDNISIAMKTAVNIGLFVNEAVSNALEHAYTPPIHGKIIVTMHEKDGEVVLIIQDYGKGSYIKNNRQNSLGMILMEDIANGLNGGELYIENDMGTKVILTFTIDEKSNDKEQ